MNPTIILNLIAIFIGTMVVTLVDMQSRGFISTFIACKMSKGKKIFIMVKSLNGGYFKTGKVLESKQVQFKDGDKKKQLLTIEDKTYKEQWFGIQFLRYDEVEKHLETSDKIITLFDPRENENLYERSQKEPPRSVGQYMKKEKILLIIFVVVAATAYYVFKIREGVMFNTQELTTIKTLVKSLAATKVVIP